MLPLAIIATCVLVTLVGPNVSGYTVSHSQDYPGSYSSAGFVGLKDNQDHLANGNYATASSHRYSAVGGGHSSSANYADGSQSSSYGGHAGASTPDALNSITASYQADSSSSDLNSNYSPSGQNIEYSSSGQHGSTGSVSFAGYAGGQSSDLGVEYASPSSATYATQQLSYSGPKGSTYSQHAPSQYSGSSVNYIPAGHTTSSSGGSHGSSYTGSYSGSFPGSRHPSSSYADGPRFSPSAALKSYLSNMHREGPATFHQPNYVHASPSASYSKGPGPSGFFGLPKGAKIIIIKDSNGAHAIMHPESALPGMFSPASSTYKVRSAGPYSSGPHYASSGPTYSHSPYSSGGGHSGGPSSYFNFS